MSDPRTPAPAAPERPRTLVVVHRNGIGDLVWHIPYLRAIAATSARGRITLLTRPTTLASQLLAAESCIEEILEFDRATRRTAGRSHAHAGLCAQWRFVQTLRSRHFDRALIFSGNMRQAMLCWLAGIPVRAGFGFERLQRLFLNRPPYIERYTAHGNWVYPEATAFAIAQGLAEHPLLPRMTVTEDALRQARDLLPDTSRPRCALVVGASETSKNWGEQRFSALATALAQSSHDVVFIGGPAEQAPIARMRAAVPAVLQQHVRGFAQSSIQLSAALLRRCDCCVGNDTGVLSMAAANGVPSLGLFGATPALRHDPLLQGIEAAGLDKITVNDVLQRLGSLHPASR